MCVVLAGSSPLTRGKHAAPHSTREQIGLIPAHAGKTRSGPRLPLMRTAHPRSRGENNDLVGDAGRVQGSSPLTRGKPAGTASITRMEGLIPAHAGKTSAGGRNFYQHEAHPRSRGENTRRPAFRSPAKGSSPLTRGKLPVDSRLDSVERLIPAHAGKTIPLVYTVLMMKGSSPLTRGKRQADRVRSHSGGLIPAHAGKTRLRSCVRARLRAHPRSRGENSLTLINCAPLPGSSPLTRGKLVSKVKAATLAGLIPAHAGKTATNCNELIPTRAHPRSRGENGWWVWVVCRTAGSSPLTRGKLSWLIALVYRAGLIPAHAGKTPNTDQNQPRVKAHPRSRGENDQNQPRVN